MTNDYKITASVAHKEQGNYVGVLQEHDEDEVEYAEERVPVTRSEVFHAVNTALRIDSSAGRSGSKRAFNRISSLNFPGNVMNFMCACAYNDYSDILKLYYCCLLRARLSR